MARRPTQSRAVALGVVVVVVLIGVMALLSLLVSRGSVKTQLGDDEAGPYVTKRLAAEIADRGPFLVPDASPSRSRDIYVQHDAAKGDDDGWYAFAARAPGQDDRACSLQWSGEDFVDPCTSERFPPDGTGLTPYTTRVDAGRLYVRLNDAPVPTG